ncbi:hypothetical protein FHR23_002297 [Stakelama sediminis]|uniref:Uncharacterized protein n=1 Tax=Stakelama sediminis TaxID=463200 RepID=A0A840Z0W5_9SPHN|nr:hypothetical protein [Stakelama sediminis]
MDRMSPKVEQCPFATLLMMSGVAMLLTAILVLLVK